MFSLCKFFVITLMMIAALITADQVFGLKLGTERITDALTITPAIRKAPKPASVDPETVMHPQEIQHEKPPRDREWVVDGVKIDGKIYPYNPRNVYVINGVATYYDPGRKRKADANEGSEAAGKPTLREVPVETPRPNAASKTVEMMAEKAPLSVYSPQGVKAVMDGARDAARMQKENAKALEHLSRESDGQ